MDDRWEMGQAIVDGLRPFKPTDLVVSVERDLDFNRYRIIGEAWFKNNYEIKVVVREDFYDMTSYPVESMYRTAVAMRDAFRNRECVPVEDNIILGDN